jgi:hypothetical protein
MTLRLQVCCGFDQRDYATETVMTLRLQVCCGFDQRDYATETAMTFRLQDQVGHVTGREVGWRIRHLSYACWRGVGIPVCVCVHVYVFVYVIDLGIRRLPYAC